MNLFSHTGDRVYMLASLENSVHVFNEAVLEPIEYDSPLCIFYVQQGKIEKRVNNRKFQLSSGDLMLVAPDSRVSFSSLGKFNGVFVFFSDPLSLLPDQDSNVASTKGEFSKSLFNNYNLQKHTNTKLRNYFNHLIQYSESDLRPFEKISNLLKNDTTYYFERLPLVNRKRISTKLDILQRVENIKLNIEENCALKFNLDTIAKDSLMSKYALIRNFKEVFKTTPHQYYILKKITLAKEFLASGMSIKETAMRCGYPDIFSFSKQFKILEGHSPRKFLLELRAAA
jgi:AraC-like DNA-binding protein